MSDFKAKVHQIRFRLMYKHNVPVSLLCQPQVFCRPDDLHFLLDTFDYHLYWPWFDRVVTSTLRAFAQANNFLHRCIVTLIQLL